MKNLIESLNTLKFGLLLLTIGVLISCSKDIEPNYFPNDFLMYDVYFGDVKSNWVSVYCTNNISIKFNKPISVADSLLSDMFYIVGDKNELIPSKVYLSEDGKVVEFFPQEELSNNAHHSYWVVVDLSNYAFSESFPYDNPFHFREKDGHKFVVRDELIVSFKSNVDTNYRDPQYGFYSTFDIGDTILFTAYATSDGKKFVDWDLPGVRGKNYTIQNKTLKIIFDCDNFFRDNNIKDGGITITALYQ